MLSARHAFPAPQVIQERRASGRKEVDVLQQFIDARYQNVLGGRQLTEDEIAGLLLAVLFAGQHTSSITSAWTGYFMIANKDKCFKAAQVRALYQPCSIRSNDTCDADASACGVQMRNGQQLNMLPPQQSNAPSPGTVN